MEYCKNEACHDEREDCLLINGKRALSFFKVMIDESFLKVLYFPPKFARSVSHLKDQETYLEDSSGRQWRVTVCNHNDSLAIEQGWSIFSSEHGLKVGDFLVFHYVPSDQHFIVQIFGMSGCEKINIRSDIGKGKQKVTTSPEASTLLQITSGPSEPEKVTYKPTIDSDTGKGQSAKYVDESLCMIDTNAQYDQEHDRLCLDLSSFEMPMSKSLAQGTSSCDNGKGKKRARTCLEAIPLLQITDNHVETKLSEPHLDVEIDSEALLPEFEAGTAMVSKPTEDVPLVGPKDDKSKEASQFDSGEEYASSETGDSGDTTSLASSEPDDSGDTTSLASSEPGDSGDTTSLASSEPGDSGDTTSLNWHEYSFLVMVDGRDFLELPESWKKYLPETEILTKWIIFLRGPDNRIWPAFYHTRSGFHDILTCGWKQVTAIYGVRAGDLLLFQLVNKKERIFDVRKI